MQRHIQLRFMFENAIVLCRLNCLEETTLVLNAAMAVKTFPEVETRVPSSHRPDRRVTLYTRRVKDQHLRLKLVIDNHDNALYDNQEKKGRNTCDMDRRKHRQVNGMKSNYPPCMATDNKNSVRLVNSVVCRDIGTRLRQCGDSLQGIYDSRACPRPEPDDNTLLHDVPVWVRVSALTGCAWFLWRAWFT